MDKITLDNKGIDKNGDWIFKPDPLYYSQTGYEDYMHIITKYDCRDFKTRYSQEQKQEMVEEIFEVYRKVNIFPIEYYSDWGVEQEILDVMKRDYRLEKNGKYLANKYNNGLSVCKYLFPNLHKAERVDCASMLDRFFDDKQLRIAIQLALDLNYTASPTAIFNALTLTRSAPTNFKPISAKALYEYFTPKGGLVYDSSCGFGGRLMGALTSYNEYQYIGTDPNKDIQNSLHRLGHTIEAITNRKDAFKIFCIGSEDFRLKGVKEIADFSFTSPPYFNCEIYSKDITQSYNKFSNGVVQWLEGFLRPTIRNTRDILKPGAFYGLNIADFNSGGKRVAYVDHAIRIAEQEGFKYQYEIKMPVTTRIGSGFEEGNSGSRERNKAEGVYIFKKC